jgi:phage-related protein
MLSGMKLKELIWIGSSKKDLINFSEDIRDAVGYGLYIAQLGNI